MRAAPLAVLLITLLAAGVFAVWVPYDYVPSEFVTRWGWVWDLPGLRADPVGGTGVQPASVNWLIVAAEEAVVLLLGGAALAGLALRSAPRRELEV